MDEALKNKTCGLCGLYDGNPDNDFFLQDKSLVTSPSTFAADYKKSELTGGRVLNYELISVWHFHIL